MLGEAAEEFVGELGRRLCKTTGESRSRKYLLQRIAIAMQRGNAAAVLGTMGKPQLDSCEWLLHVDTVYVFIRIALVNYTVH